MTTPEAPAKKLGRKKGSKDVKQRALKGGSPELMAKRVDAYVAKCESLGKPMTICGLTLALGFSSRQSLYTYLERPDYKETVELGRLYVEEQVEEELRTKPNVAGAIFTLKQFGWKDTQTQEIHQEFKDISDKPLSDDDWTEKHSG